MKKIYSTILLALTGAPLMTLANSREFVSVELLAQQGKIGVSIEGTGGYQEQCIHMIVQNFTADSVHALVEPGRRLNSVNDAEQDILVVKAQQIALSAGQADTFSITGFCCEASKHSPGPKSAFTIGMLAPATWLILTNIIDKFKFPPAAVQHAIWVLSNNHDIRSIPAFNNPETDQLRHTVADILDIELPWYSFNYKADSTDLFTGTKSHLFAEVPFKLPFQALISTQITDKAGNIIHEAYAGSFKEGQNTLSINIPIETWAATEYDLYIMEDFHTMNKKLSFSLKEPEESEE